MPHASPVFGAHNNYERRRVVVAKKDYVCSFCKNPIFKGDKYVLVTIPPWFGEWDGEYDDGGPRAWPINTGKWTTRREHYVTSLTRPVLPVEVLEAHDLDGW